MKKNISYVLLGFLLFLIPKNSLAQADFEDDRFLALYNSYTLEGRELAQEKYIIDVETARHYCALTNAEGSCLIDNAVRLKATAICKNKQCVAYIAIAYEDLAYCEEIENEGECYSYITSLGSQDSALVAEACLRSAKLSRIGAYECIARIHARTGDDSDCQFIKDSKYRSRCEIKTAENHQAYLYKQRTNAFDGKLDKWSPEFYALYAVYGFLILLISALYFYVPKSYFRNFLIFNLIILVLIIIIGKSLKLGAVINYLDLIERHPPQPGDYPIRDFSSFLAPKHLLFQYLPEWALIAYYNLIDWLVAALLSLIFTIGISNWETKPYVLFNINLAFFIFLHFISYFSAYF